MARHYGTNFWLPMPAHPWSYMQRCQYETQILWHFSIAFPQILSEARAPSGMEKYGKFNLLGAKAWKKYGIGSFLGKKYGKFPLSPKRFVQLDILRFVCRRSRKCKKWGLKIAVSRALSRPWTPVLCGTCRLSLTHFCLATFKNLHSDIVEAKSSIVLNF